MCKMYLATAGLLGLILTGCSSFADKTAESLSGKNTNLDGYVFYGSGEAVNSETAAPEAKVIIGRLTYKSRKVGIPDGMKTPNTGYFKATKTKSLFGTEEQIIEYDFTASDARTALEIQERLQKTIPVEQTE